MTSREDVPTPLNPEAERESTWTMLGWLALFLVGIYLLLGPRLELRNWYVDRSGNASLEEALQWKQGTLAMQRHYEMAHVGDKYYNVAGLSFTIISFLATSLNNLVGGRPDEFFPLHYVMIVALPIPFAAFWAFRRVTGASPYAAFFSTYLLAGTCLETVLRWCQRGGLHFIDHALATTGLLIFAGDLLGRRRIWPAALGLVLAAWSRPMTVIYAPALPWIAWRRHDSITQRGRGASAVIGVMVVLLVPMTLSYFKFGNPFDSGLSRIYEGRTDAIGVRGREAIFSPRYIPMQLKAMLWLPAWDVRGGSLYPMVQEGEGGNIFLTSPLLLAIFITAGSWWREADRRLLMICSLGVICGLCFYHTTGSQQYGFYRYSLDFIPIWLAVVAPYLCHRRALPWLLACLALAALYFRMLG